jgi:hypothetical protein
MDLKPLELEALIRKIAKDAVDKVLIKPEGPEVKAEEPVDCGRRLLVLVPGLTAQLQASLKHIERSLPDYRPTVEFFEGLDTAEDACRKRIIKNIDNFDAVVCISPGIKQMEAIARCDDTGFLERLVLFFILHSKPASLLLDFDVRMIRSNTFSKRMSSLMESIREMGITVDMCRSNTGGTETCASVEKSLVTEKSLQDLWNTGVREISCGRGCVITPLARDKANELGMNIVYKESKVLL